LGIDFVDECGEGVFFDLTVSVFGRYGGKSDKKHDDGTSEVSPDVNSLIMELE
jgi:hypothetical protein